MRIRKIIKNPNMKVSEAIKNTDHFIITKDGNILGISNSAGVKLNSKLLNLDVQKIEIMEGLIEDVICIRL